ncbi:MAG TPA: three-Cys-motif partner protein TcmP [Phycisphaerae bacterium]|nr:three-Cys-motif partner protein TcmP [Phycisphaerae bacterium]
MTRFHDNVFDDATQLKLEIFRGYIREWLPVFLTQYKGSRSQRRQVNLFDFFAGPGHDCAGHPGSPLIIVEELKRFCEEGRKASSLDIRILFNDADSGHIERLKAEVAKIACRKACCRVEYSALPFHDALQSNLRLIQDSDSANLVIMDQFGVKEVTPEVVRQFASCGTTDILFFISSSYIRRFIDTPELASKFDMVAQEVRTLDYNGTHRFVCDYFRESLGGLEYYLAPFSIRKGSNIYGVVFGSGSFLGLEKFLKVCWKKDAVTGEANYNIDGDFAWAGEQSLFEEQNVITKVELFEHQLEQFVQQESPTNRDIYEFSLLRGFRPSDAAKMLRSMRRNGTITIVDLRPDTPSKPGACYVTWHEYRKNSPRVRFTARSEP